MAHGRGVEHPDRLQPGLGGFHDLLSADGEDDRLVPDYVDYANRAVKVR